MFSGRFWGFTDSTNVPFSLYHKKMINDLFNNSVTYWIKITVGYVTLKNRLTANKQMQCDFIIGQCNAYGPSFWIKAERLHSKLILFALVRIRYTQRCTGTKWKYLSAVLQYVWEFKTCNWTTANKFSIKESVHSYFTFLKFYMF